MRDITGIEDVPAAPAPSYPALAIFLFAAILVIGTLIAIRVLTRRRRSPPLPADQWALRELDLIEAPVQPSPETIANFHTSLSRVIRGYLEQQFQLPASRQTTEEFFETLRYSAQLRADDLPLLHEFLNRCDLGKFARVLPSSQECQKTSAMARRFIEQTAAPTRPDTV